MHVFRSAAEQGNSRSTDKVYQDGDRAITVQSRQRREGVDEGELRRHLSIDLDNLMNTIRLDAIIPLDNYPYVARSVLNFGFKDMSSLSRSRQTETKIAASIRQSLIDHEPRLIPESIEINISASKDSNTQRVSYEVVAEMAADPVDIPLDFVAEVDLGAGKMKMKRLRVQK